MSDSASFQSENLVLVSEVRQLIDAAKQRAAVAVNAEISLLHWQVVKRIQLEVLQGERTEYGEQVVNQLTEHYGNGWGVRQLRYCIRLADVFNNAEIVRKLCSQLSWLPVIEVKTMELN